MDIKSIKLILIVFWVTAYPLIMAITDYLQTRENAIKRPKGADYKEPFTQDEISWYYTFSIIVFFVVLAIIHFY